MNFCTPNYRRYGPGYGFKDAPETVCTCPLCGLDVAWWREPYEKDVNLVYHLHCWIQESDDCD